MARISASTGTINANGNILIPVTTNFTGEIVFTAAGNLNVKGNWSHDGTFTKSTSTVTFNGTSTQTISGSQALDFNNLVVNKSTNNLSLSQNITFTGTLTLTSGLIVTNALSVQAGSVASISGASSSSYVSGILKRIYSATGTKNFPIGKGGNYRPVDFNYTSLTGTSTVSIEQFESALTGTLPANTNLNSSRYWMYRKQAVPHLTIS
jgi:hypothetical protein